MNSSADHARALIARAQDGRYVLERLAGDANSPAWVLGFHAQQAVEKSLKAVLSHRKMEYPRTHNLSMLMELLRRAGVRSPPDGDELARLIPFGVALRYEDAAGGEALSFDRAWAVRAVAKTLVWACDALAGMESPKQS